MKKKLLHSLYIVAFFTAASLAASAQWCVPTTILPYASSMPGITHVVIGSIDRTSADLEHYPNNSYVNTGLSTDLIMGNTYTISITHTVDASICPDMNIRVWIDYNLDYSFDDAGETVISVNHHAAGTYTGTFTVPATTAGVSRMRITAKMSDVGGHTLPTPCDFPPDPLGYHGEDEDYNVNLINATDISSPEKFSASLNVYPSVITDHATISLKPEGISSVRICNVTGTIVWTSDVSSSPNGIREISIDEKILARIRPGVYFVSTTGTGKNEIKRIVVL
jgi:hypothetical protein